MLVVLGAIGIYAADHIDAPAVQGTSSDITDLYVFQSPANNDNMVFDVNTQGLLSPAATQNAVFETNTMIEFNIDNDGDLVEDLVIQCVFTEDKVFSYGPVAPNSTGLTSTVNIDGTEVSAEITSLGEDPKVGIQSARR